MMTSAQDQDLGEAETATAPSIFACPSEDGALALFGAGKHQLGHPSTLWLLNTDLDETATNGALIAADAVGSVRTAGGCSVTRALLRRLPLGTDSAVGGGTKATNAGLSR